MPIAMPDLTPVMPEVGMTWHGTRPGSEPGIIQAHGGKITIKTKIGQGTAFLSGSLHARRTFSKGKILVIDDEDIVRLSCSRTLVPEGY